MRHFLIVGFMLALLTACGSLVEDKNSEGVPKGSPLTALKETLSSGSAYAQSNLPECPSSGPLHNCFNTSTISGTKFVIEWKDGKPNGQAIITYTTGVKFVGEWKDGKLNGKLYNANGSILGQHIEADDKIVSSAPVQQATIPSHLGERLKAEAEEAKRKQAEAEESIRVAQQLASQTRENERLRAEAEESKRKQAEAELRLAQQQASQTKQNSSVTAQSVTPMSKRVALVVGIKTTKSAHFRTHSMMQTICLAHLAQVDLT